MRCSTIENGHSTRWIPGVPNHHDRDVRDHQRIYMDVRINIT